MDREEGRGIYFQGMCRPWGRGRIGHSGRRQSCRVKLGRTRYGNVEGDDTGASESLGGHPPGTADYPTHASQSLMIPRFGYAFLFGRAMRY